MRIDIDTYREIIDTLARNKSRSLLTGFGVFWGVFMLVALIGGGQGMKEMLSKNFEGFATNSALVFPQPTSKAYGGFQKGRNWWLVYKDVDRLKAQVPELDIVSPVLSSWNNTAVYGDKRCTCILKGLRSDYTQVETPQIRFGRYITDMDDKQRRKVCVLGKKIYSTLFPGGENPCGKFIRIDSIHYNIVGVDFSTGNISVNGSSQDAVIIPISVMQKTYNNGDKIGLICATAHKGVVMSEIAQRMRDVISRAHTISPDDEKGVTVFNTEVMFGMVDSLFNGVNFLIWLVGIGTLLAGAIGVSNIMMVTVRERTVEIGIRRAIGATPYQILSQIISESVALTSVAGISGILLAVSVLQLVEMGTTTNGIAAAHFQIGFWTAVGATILLSVLGVLAGLAPAMRAMRIKPVDAMRDE
ncbi:MAG: ABC transporter permease [Alloprevotella sp.]